MSALHPDTGSPTNARAQHLELCDFSDPPGNCKIGARHDEKAARLETSPKGRDVNESNRPGKINQLTDSLPEPPAPTESTVRG